MLKFGYFILFREHIIFFKKIIKLIIHFPEPIVGNELVSVAINLAANKRNAETIAEEEFQKVLDRAIENKDILLLKFIRNISINGNIPMIQDCLAVK